MANEPLKAVLRQLRRLVGVSAGAEFSDGHLLRRFAEHRDEAAFEALLRRHGPLVLGVCRRVLGDEHDAEDAFQATFLVLARRAGALDRGGTVAGFLYTVASRIALRAKADAARRRRHEKQAVKIPMCEADNDLVWRDLRPVLDEELNRLPEKYRSPILLCYLEGKTQEEAAALLGWTKGTVSGRLARARELLRGRLARRGLTLSAAALSAGLTEQAGAAVPALLRRAALEGALGFAVGQTPVAGAAADLAQAALREIGALKGKSVAALLLAATILAAGTGALMNRQATLPSPTQPKGEDEKAGAKRVDVHGDPLPPGAVVRLGTIRLCQGGQGVRSAAFSPNGRLLASSGHYGDNQEVIRLWDVATGKEIRHFPGVANHLAFSPDGNRLAAGREFGQLCLWNVSTGKQLWCWDVNADARAVEQPAPKFYGIAFSSDGRTLAVAVGDKTIGLRETDTGKERLRLKGETASNIAFSPDGKILASADFMAKTVCLWRLSTAEKLHILTHPNNVYSFAFSPDGRNLAVLPGGNKVFLWDVVKGKELRQVDAPGVGSLIRFSPDGKKLMTGAWSFDLATGKETRRDGRSRAIALSPNGRLSADTDWGGTLRVWDMPTGKEVVKLDRHHGWVHYAVPSADGKTIRTVGQFDRTIRDWDAAGGKHLRMIQTAPWQKFLALSADGKVSAMPRWDQKLVAIELASGKIIQECGEANSWIGAMALSANGKHLAVLSGEKEKVVRLWDMVAGKELRRLLGVMDDSSRLAFSSDGKTVAAAASLDSLRLWDVATGKVLKEPAWKAKRRTNPFDESIRPVPFDQDHGIALDPKAKPSPAAELVFSPSGQTLAVMSGFHRERWAMFDPPDAGLLRLYDVTTRKELFQLCRQEPVAAFSPDGKKLATGGHHDCAVYLWDAITGRQLTRFLGHRGAITSLAFSADGRTVISGSADSTALVWDVTWRGR